MTEAVPAHPTPEGSPQQLGHHGQGQELFALSLSNQVLKVFTLGVYHFWGKTRVRRYLWSHTAFAGDRFEYTGRGGELLRGFMVALLVLAPLGLGFPYLPDFLGAGWGAGVVSNILFYGLFLFLTGVATFSARRYLLSRTRLRGIRFGLSGSAWRHGLRLVAYTGVTVLTLGFYTPFMRTHLMGHVMGNTWFGNQRAGFSGDGRGLFRKFLWAWTLVLLLLVPWVLLLGGALGFFGGGAGGGSWLPVLAVLFPLLVMVPGLGLILIWYRGEELRYFSDHLTLGPLRVAARYTTGEFLRFGVANFLLLTLTLGLAFPFVAVRVAGFAARHLEFSGELDFAAVAQNTQQMPAAGEGLAEAFDLGAV